MENWAMDYLSIQIEDLINDEIDRAIILSKIYLNLNILTSEEKLYLDLFLKDCTQTEIVNAMSIEFRNVRKYHHSIIKKLRILFYPSIQESIEFKRKENHKKLKREFSERDRLKKKIERVKMEIMNEKIEQGIY